MTTRPTFVLLTLSYFLCATVQWDAPSIARAASASSAHERADAARRAIATLYGQGRFHGAVLIANGDSLVLRHGWGLANRSVNIPNGTDVRFWIASVTKPLVATVVMQLVEEGLVELHEPVSTYLTDLDGYPVGSVTIHQLLTHTAGVPSRSTNARALAGITAAASTPALKELVRDYAAEPPEFTPGTSFRYSNAGYNVLGSILESATGMTFADVMRSRLFEPAGMIDSGVYDATSALPSGGTVRGYVRVPGEILDARSYNTAYVLAAGGVYSTLEDLQRFYRALKNETLISSATLAKMTKVVEQSRGYGWIIEQMSLPDGGHTPLIHHGGGIPGYTTRIAYLPQHDLFIATYDNTYEVVTRLVIQTAALVMLGYEAKLPPPDTTSPVVADVIARGFEKVWPEITARAQALSVALSPDDLNTWGYRLLHADRAADAISVFNLYCHLHAQDGNAFDSLGEAYIAAGDFEKALSSYQRAFALDPENANAVEQIERLQSRKGGL